MKEYLVYRNEAHCGGEDRSDLTEQKQTSALDSRSKRNYRISLQSLEPIIHEGLKNSLSRFFTRLLDLGIWTVNQLRVSYRSHPTLSRLQSCELLRLPLRPLLSPRSQTPSGLPLCLRRPLMPGPRSLSVPWKAEKERKEAGSGKYNGQGR